MDDLYCPSCRLLLYGPAAAWIAPEHCPRCASHARQVRLIIRASITARRPRTRTADVGAPGGRWPAPLVRRTLLTSSRRALDYRRAMDDLYCPSCDLILYRRRLAAAEPTLCPRCLSRFRRPAAFVTIDADPLADQTDGC